ncbi:MAG: V-type ATPase subunit [Thermodesulfobacteriota bacterium]|nr:V-type ATPase subunit [Thermodesulfobacteriota bacterium]
MNQINPRYAFTSAYLKGEEARSISAEHIDGMFQRTMSLQDILDSIKDTDIGEYLLEFNLGGTKTFDGTDEFLWTYFGECLERLRRFKLPSEMDRMLDSYIKKYDIANIKTALRKVLEEKTADLSPLGTIYSEGYLEALSNAKSTEEISEVLESCNLYDYSSIINDIKEKEARSTFEGEFRLESLYHKTMRSSLEDMSDGGVLVKSLGIMIDLTNLQVVFRSALGKKNPETGDFILDGGHMLSVNTIKELLSLNITEIIGRLEATEYHQMAREISRGYENEQTIAVVDKIMESYRFILLRDLLSPRALSPCNLFWYLIIKESEIRNVRIILKSIEDGIQLSDVRDYLVTA